MPALQNSLSAGDANKTMLGDLCPPRLCFPGCSPICGQFSVGQRNRRLMHLQSCLSRDTAPSSSRSFPVRRFEPQEHLTANLHFKKKQNRKHKYVLSSIEKHLVCFMHQYLFLKELFTILRETGQYQRGSFLSIIYLFYFKEKEVKLREMGMCYR